MWKAALLFGLLVLYGLLLSLLAFLSRAVLLRGRVGGGGCVVDGAPVFACRGELAVAGSAAS